MIPFPCTLIILALLENFARVLHRTPGGGTVPQRSVARTRRLLLGDQATHVLQDHRAPHQLRRLPEPARVHSGHEPGLPELLQIQRGTSVFYIYPGALTGLGIVEPRAPGLVVGIRKSLVLNNAYSHKLPKVASVLIPILATLPKFKKFWILLRSFMMPRTGRF